MSECDGERTNASMTPIQQTRLDETSALKTALLMTTLTTPSFCCDAANFPVLVGTLCLMALSLSLLLFDDDDDDDDDDGGRRKLAPMPILPRGGGGSGYACTGSDDSRMTFPLHVAPPRAPLSSRGRLCSTKNMTTWSGCRSHHHATTTTIRSRRTGTASRRHPIWRR